MVLHFFLFLFGKNIIIGYNYCMNLLAFLIVLFAVVIICGVSSCWKSTEKLSSFLALKSISSISLLTLVILSGNLTSNIGNFTLFIMLACGIQCISFLLSCLPVRGNILAPLYQSLDLVSYILLCISGFLMISPSPFGLPIGFGIGAIIMIIYLGVTKPYNWKEKILPAFIFAFNITLLGQAIVGIIAIQVLYTIFFLSASLSSCIFSIMNTFFDNDNHIFYVCKNIFYYLTFILFAISIFLF